MKEETQERVLAYALAGTLESDMLDQVSGGMGIIPPRCITLTGSKVSDVVVDG